MGKPRRTLQQCQEYADSRGGKCLAAAYVNENGKLHWRCEGGHEWMATAASTIRAKCWCPRCASALSGLRKRKTLDDCRTLASSKGGACLSKKYTNSKSKLRWRCLCGNAWYATYNTVQNGHWCRHCANLRKQRANHLGIEKMHALAAQRHGKCESTHYENTNSILDWACSAGHRFPARVSNVIAGSWCPSCTGELSNGSGLSEHLCRSIFENLYRAQFPRCRPDWLRSESGARMELDGYNEELAIAFEYQGIQHYGPVIKFKSDHTRHAALQNRDEQKAMACAHRKITLVAVPYTVGKGKLEIFIRNELQRHGKALASWRQLPELDLWLPGVRMDTRLADVKLRGLHLGLACISSTYLLHDTPLLWCCQSCGHEFPFRPDRLDKVASPCKKCRMVAEQKARRERMLWKIHSLLDSRGEKLTSRDYDGQSTRLDIECSGGHTWQTTWASLRHGTECPECRFSESKY